MKVRRDPTARIEPLYVEEGFIFPKRVQRGYTLVASGLRQGALKIEDSEYARFRDASDDVYLSIAVPEKGLTWWKHKGEWFRASHLIPEEAIPALIRELREREQARLDRLTRGKRVTTTSYNDPVLGTYTIRTEVAEDAPARSRRIPDDVKREVWRRDEGKCVKCGSRERLEYNHIVPFSRGGSNTARNIELLCEPCNRALGDHI